MNQRPDKGRETPLRNRFRELMKDYGLDCEPPDKILPLTQVPTQQEQKNKGLSKDVLVIYGKGIQGGESARPVAARNLGELSEFEEKEDLTPMAYVHYLKDDINIAYYPP